jgi:hypothetical protein
MRAQGQQAREGVARDRIAQVEPRLSYVVVRLGADWTASALSSAHVTLDGQELAAAQLGARRPVDSGEHSIAVTAEGKRAWATRVKVQGEAETLAVEVPRLEDERPANEPSAPGPPAAEAALARPLLAPRREVNISPGASGFPAQRVLSLGLLGAAVVAGGLGTYFGVRAFELGKESRTGCSNGGCSDPNARLQAEDSHTYGDASTVSFVACGLLAAAGGVLWFTAPSDASKRAIVVVPGWSPRAALWVQGRF